MADGILPSCDAPPCGYIGRAVMRERCEAWRARAASGMSDAGAAVFTAPDSAPRAAAAAFVQYCQSDSLDPVATDSQARLQPRLPPSLLLPPAGRHSMSGAPGSPVAVQ